jgi:hypothetical protein
MQTFMRSLGIVLLLLFAGGCLPQPVPKSPEAKYLATLRAAGSSAGNKQLEHRLIAFAQLFENHNWICALSYFDPDHINAQFKLYMYDEFMFDHLGKPAERDFSSITRLYLRETMGLDQLQGNLETIQRMQYTATADESENLWSVSFQLILRDGSKINGGFYVNKSTIAFSGAWG